LRKFLLNILPESVIVFYKNSKKQKRLKQRELLISQKIIVNKQQISEKLKSIGIKNGDLIMLHSSLSKIGFVENGANTVIDAFTEVLGNFGTLVMPAFPSIGFNYDYLRTNPVFNLNSTPSKMGIITEVFRKKEHVFRSLHPTDSVCAIGKHAEYLVKDHFNQLTPYNSHSPFYKLTQLHGKIILIGIDLNCLTNFHAAEDAITNFEFPIYHKTHFNSQVIDENGNKKSMLTKVHNPGWSKKRKCNDFIVPFQNAGFLEHFTIGNAKCMVINANEMHNWLVDNYKTKGISLYTPQGK